ncbi:hypothetical protein [Candidatus Colwellia aromaticivorans]|uniref:hypothetical protein n=1 Tax=Candidatus Colwellia aromaticivorans TaxID=2267621 RepID=UPI000DF2CFE8|nr:hypothetical protein [Candidatus Colwellia aromaticivorans]
MSSESDKGLYEIEVFNQFCSKLSHIEVSGVVKCFPPKPDLVCNFDGKVTYFELARNYTKESAKPFLDCSNNTNEVWGEDSTNRILHAKLEKKYLVKEPIQLLLYDDLELALPNDVVISTIKYILSNRKNVQFDKIWYFAEDEAIEVYSANKKINKDT